MHRTEKIFYGRIKFAAILIVIPILTACAGMTASNGIDCSIYQPIEWSSADTDLTLKQIKAHNAVWVDRCK